MTAAALCAAAAVAGAVAVLLGLLAYGAALRSGAESGAFGEHNTHDTIALSCTALAISFAALAGALLSGALQWPC